MISFNPIFAHLSVIQYEIVGSLLDAKMKLSVEHRNLKGSKNP